jgi:adenine deaminase
MNKLQELLRIARGDAPAETLFRGGLVANVLSGELEEVEVAVAGGVVVGMGLGLEARHPAGQVVDLSGGVLLPGFIDAHVHIESSLVTPPEFAKGVVPRGTTTVVSDPHEIANVHGVEGIHFMLDSSEGIPLSVFVMASSCVPATPMGTAGASLGVDELEGLARHPRVLGLAEVMNFPGVIGGSPEVLAKIAAFRGRPVDGHAPGVTGRALDAYVLGGPGSDHESTTAAEATEKLRRGLFLFVREATNARNLADLLPALTPANLRRVALCTDDRQPGDLLDEGGIDAMLRRLVAAGIPPLEALRTATLNPSEYFGLRDRGAVSPGRRADLVIASDLETLEVREVWVAGRRVARDGRAETWSLPSPRPPTPSLRLDPDTLSLGIPGRAGTLRVIQAVPDQIVTRSATAEPRLVDGEAVADPARDLLKIAVVERHTGSGRVGLGFVQGIGLRRGAIGGTVAHDHHNLILIGADDRSMRTVARVLVRHGGGLAVADGEDVLAVLPLPVAGLMSTDPIEVVRRSLDGAVAAAHQLGSTLHDPFMAMSFLGLEVIPTLKITDQGLVDVDRFERVELWA